MRNYEAVSQWASTVKVDKAFNEISKLKAKYPWLKCDESFLLIEKMYNDMPKILNIIKLQEKQLIIQEKLIEVNHIADESIIKAVAEKIGLEL